MKAHPPLRIVVPDDETAGALLGHLQAFDAESHAVDGRHEVRVQLGWNPEDRVTTVLSAIDSWLLDATVPFVRVHLDGRAYTLHGRAPEVSPA